MIARIFHADLIHIKGGVILANYAVNVWMMTKKKGGYMTETADPRTAL